MHNTTYTFTAAQRHHALIWLAFWHNVVIVASNYLVQLPFEIFGLKTTWGAFTYPFIFLTTDLTVRIFGAPLARRIIFCATMPALALSYLVSVLFDGGQYTGLAALTAYNPFVGRIVLASLSAYLIGQLLDITVFNRLRQMRRWWIAPTASAIVGNAIDTIVFFAIAFHHSSDPYMAAHWQEIALVDYAWKITICALFFLPAYGILLRYLTARLTTLHRRVPAACPQGE
ncbi:7-cyano-7-deazaguanine/7-aminomethyl-7-deazaguanine transporter [uncultured Cardiobacterium sp.]|uniref:7-cyano-7-deazaguanine/7-aminomethyl-7- deazaguanine transporter n=1 Tax=uncultured Cardiobacterium sp. TaxID=417619 RepID=UPI00261DE5E2|nr:7-cyano-7-deazaguanine/7-aminomethyl-7-deazaguanine transporter [uncultured Cardiobacterium sp.]